MGKGGGGSATQTTIQDVPEWAKPYYEDILKKSKAASEQPYVPYGGQRLAQPGEDITTSQQMIRSIAGAPTPGLGQAVGTIGALGQQAGQLGAPQVSPFAASRFTETGAQEFQFGPARQFTGQEVQSYMSPYIENVISRQEDAAIREAARQRAGRSAQAVQAGAFGGSRQAVQEALAEEALGTRLGDIRAAGLQSAYEQAAQQFGADRAAQMAIEQQRAAEAGRVQGVGVEEAARVQAGMAGEEARVQAARADEAMRQRQFQLQTMGFSADMAKQIADLGERARAGDIQAAQLLEAQGLGQLAREQAGFDVAYQDFLRQQGYPIEQLGAYSQFLRGLPVQGAGTTTTYQPPPSPYSQALGAGISAYGLYRGLQ